MAQGCQRGVAARTRAWGAMPKLKSARPQDRTMRARRLLRVPLERRTGLVARAGCAHFAIARGTGCKCCGRVAFLCLPLRQQRIPYLFKKHLLARRRRVGSDGGWLLQFVDALDQDENHDGDDKKVEHRL